VRLELGPRAAVLLYCEEHLLHDGQRERWIALNGQIRF
jgi:hypothetical protein